MQRSALPWGIRELLRPFSPFPHSLTLFSPFFPPPPLPPFLSPSLKILRCPDCCASLALQAAQLAQRLASVFSFVKGAKPTLHGVARVTLESTVRRLHTVYQLHTVPSYCYSSEVGREGCYKAYGLSGSVLRKQILGGSSVSC